MKHIFIFLVLFSNFWGYSQSKVKGIILDASNNTPLLNVKITNTETNAIVFTNNRGEFSIAAGNIEIYKEGYKQINIRVNKKEITILLQKTATNLEEVTINSFSIPNQQKYATDAITVLDTDDINRSNPIELHPILNRVPGVFMQNATLNTNRITIRGIGARNLFGTANIRAYFGDIPLTDGNGESAIEDLELGALSTIEIHKGPSSSSYGVGLGGTILFHPEFTKPQEQYASVSSTFGSYGLKRFLVQAALATESSNINIVYSNNQNDGYRDNNNYDRNTISIASKISLGKKDNLTVLGSYVNLKAEIPSSLNQEDFDDNPRQAAFTWGRSQAFEDVDFAILGLTWQHDYSPSLSQHTSIFGSVKQNYEPRPFNILEEDSYTFGIRSRILGTFTIAQQKINWTAGGELFLDTYNAQTFENLFEDFPPETGSVQGSRITDLDEDRNYYNLFAEANYEINQKLKLNIGVNLNQTFFDIKDRFLTDQNDSSGTFDFDPIVSPKIGVNYTLNSTFTLFGNISHGFSTPTASETLLPDGIFNPDLKPEIGWNYEVGTRYKLFNNKLYGSLSVYSLQVRDLLVARRTTEDNFFAINAGKTEHNGIEAEAYYNIITSDTWQLRFWGNISLYDYTFKDFVDLDDDFSGNDLTGAPSHVFNTGIDLISQKGFYGNLNLQTVSTIPANDANTVFSDHYELIHGKIGFKSNIGSHLTYDLFLGANNILDTKYASQLQINARGFGGNAPRYFYPGLPFNMYGGININYRL